ncbi:MAG: hypothetical protein JWQ11_510, partial [Rhizobacter sp.]|nr:hypothetical protein [Rhizobacter sp.]
MSDDSTIGADRPDGFKRVAAALR